MLPEFIAGLAVSLLLASLLFWFLQKRLRLNRNKANTIAPFYLLPVVITVLLILVTLVLVFPRILDLPHIIADNYEVVETDVSPGILVPTGVRVDGQHYFVPHRNLPKTGTKVRLYVTPNAGYVMKIDTIAEEATEDMAFCRRAKILVGPD